MTLDDEAVGMNIAAIERRIRAKNLLCKVTTPEKAAGFVRDGMALGIGTGTLIACPKTFFMALAKELKGKGKVKLFTGGPIPAEVDGLLTKANLYERRFGQFGDRDLLKAANDRIFPVIDTRTGILPHHVKDGRFGKIDVAAIQAAAITEEGYIIPTTSLLDSPSYTLLADKVIVEIDTKVPEEIEGMHDIYIPEVPPNRKPIPIIHAGDRIGTPYIPVNPDKIVAIIEANVSENMPARSPIDENSKKIANYLMDFLVNEVKHKRLPDNLLPLQFGIGNIPDAITKALCESSFSNIEIFSGTFGDGGLDLIDMGKLRVASVGCMYLSGDGFKRFYSNVAKYKPYIVMRPIVMSDCPELIARLGCIAINGAIEVDIYGHGNSSHVMGGKIMSGIGGSCDFLWNSYLSILVLPSITRGGAISCIVPMVTHVDQTEHSVDVIITEQGLADLRGLAPVERAEQIINNCAHPYYKPLLKEYLRDAMKCNGGHEPHVLEKAFSFHINYQRNGTMQLK